MNRVTVFAAAVALLVTSSPVQAQSWEVSGVVGYTPSVDLDRRAPELDQLAIRGGFTWGVQGARLFTPHWGAEALWDAAAVGTRRGDHFVRCVRLLHHDGQTAPGQRAV